MTHSQPPKPTLLGNYAYNLAYQVVMVAAPLITMPYLSRVLGAEGIGVFGYAHSIALYFVLVGTLGGATYGQRAIAYVQGDAVGTARVFKEIVSVRAICTTISSVLYVALCFAFFKENHLIVFLPFTIEITAAAIDISWFYMGVSRFKVFALRNILARLAGTALIFIFVKSSDDIWVYALCYCLPILAGNAAMWLAVPRRTEGKTKGVRLSVARHFAPMLALLVPQAAIEVYVVLDKTMLGLLGSSMQEVGYYEQSQKIIKVTLMMITAFGMVMLSRVAGAHAKGDEEKIKSDIALSFRAMFALGFPLVFGLMAVAEGFVPWFYGSGFDKVAMLLVINSPVILLIGISNIIGRQLLLPTGREKAYTVSVLIGMSVNIVCNLILIRNWDSVGAAVASIIAELGVTVVQLIMVRKILPVFSFMKQGLRYLLFGCAVFAVAAFSGRYVPLTFFGTGIQILSGVAVYLVLLAVSRDALLRKVLAQIKSPSQKHRHI